MLSNDFLNLLASSQNSEDFISKYIYCFDKTPFLLIILFLARFKETIKPMVKDGPRDISNIDLGHERRKQGKYLLIF